MLKRFIYIWITYWLIYLIQPAHSIHGGIWSAFFLQLAFVLSVAGGFILPFHRSHKSYRVIQEMRLTEQVAQQIVLIGFLLSLAGLALLAYDKLVIQQIDYSAGIANARDQWRILGERRDGGASSIYSIIGYLLGSAYFLPIAILTSRNVYIEERRRMLLLFFGISLLMFNSLLTGGRSVILLMLAFVSYSYFSANIKSKLFSSTSLRVILWLSLGGTASYTLYVFSARAESSHLNLVEYSSGMLAYLRMEPSAWFVALVNHSELGGFYALLNLATAYITHSMATAAAIIDFEGGREIVVFGYLIELMHKVGLVADTAEPWFLAGRFPSLPGGLFHQMGLPFMLISGMILGWVGGYISRMHRITPDSISLLFAACIIESILLLSPFLFAGDFLFFPFMVTGGLLSIVLAKLILRHR